MSSDLTRLRVYERREHQPPYTKCFRAAVSMHCHTSHQRVNAGQRDWRGRRTTYIAACAAGARRMDGAEDRNRDRLYALRGARRFGERLDRRDLSGATGSGTGPGRGLEL